MGINPFNSSSYFFNFLTLSILLLPAYLLIGKPIIRRYALIFTGLYLLYSIAPRLMLFYCIFWLIIYCLQRLIFYFSEKRSGLVFLWCGLFSALLPMISWKWIGEDFNVPFNVWTNIGLEFISLRLWEIDLARNIIIPIGLSFATFRAVDLLVKTYLGRLSGLSLNQLMFYGFFPPVQVVGPIIEYEEIQKQGDTYYQIVPDDIFSGFLKIAIGLLKAVVLAGFLQDSVSVFNTAELPGVWAGWFGLIIYMWYFYLSFSGYSDIAIGAARLFGFKLNPNFNWPYFSPNLSDFWNRWHISLSKFCQRNIFVPFGGYRVETRYFATLATMMAIALWHDLSASMILFGLYHSAGLIGHRYFQEHFSHIQIFPENTFGEFLKALITYLYVALSFPMLAIPLSEAVNFYFFLFGLG